MATKVTQKIDAGSYWSRQLEYKDSAENPIDLTGYTAAMQLRLTADPEDDTPPAISLTDTSGITLGGAAGTILIEITATQSAALTSKKYFYDLEITPADGKTVRLIEGVFQVDPNITR